MPLESLNEACGVFGVHAPTEDVARVTFFGLYALQHRGQESAGIATTDGHAINVRKDMGLVSQVFQEEDLLHLRGFAAIGHTRYSTTGGSRIENAQPLVVEGPNGTIALGHNGNIVNAEMLRAELEADGRSFEGSTDAEVIAHLVATAPGRRLLFCLGNLRLRPPRRQVYSRRRARRDGADRQRGHP